VAFNPLALREEYSTSLTGISSAIMYLSIKAKKSQGQSRIGESPHALKKELKIMPCSSFLEREVKCEKWVIFSNWWWNLQDNQRKGCQLQY